jgi:bifunctional non-homologous end joining protein LigD
VKPADPGCRWASGNRLAFRCFLNGYDLQKLPLLKAMLKKLIANMAIQFSERFKVDGREMYQHACKVGYEGVVSKVR